MRFLLARAAEDPDLVVDMIIDVVSRGLGKMGGRPPANTTDDGPARPHCETAATRRESPATAKKSEIGVEIPPAEPVSKPGESPNSDVCDLGSEFSLSLSPDRISKQSSLVDRRSNGRSGRVTVLPPGFADFYALYPRKDAKQDAIRAWERAVRENYLPPLEDLMTALVWQVEDWDAERPPRPEDKMPLPATWINGKRWERSRSGRREPEMHPRDRAAIESITGGGKYR